MVRSRAKSWARQVAALLLAVAALSCTEEATERPVFNGPNRLPGLRAGGAQDVAGYDRAVETRVPLTSEFELAGWINNLTSNLPEPETTDDLTLHGLIALESTAEGTIGIVQIAIGSQKLLPVSANKGATGGHIGVVIAVDESGSMGSAGKLRSLRSGLHNLILALPTGVHFGLVGFAGHARTLWPVQAYEPTKHMDALLAAKAKVRAAGGTNMHEGLERALQMAESIDAELDFRHVILVTDGRPSRGLVDQEHFRSLRKNRKRDVAISTIGVGDAFDVELLALLSGDNNPTWMMETPASLEWSLTDAYRTIGSPPTPELIVEVELADGWKVVQAPGLRLDDLSNGAMRHVEIRGPMARLVAQRAEDAAVLQTQCDVTSGADADAGGSAPAAPEPSVASFSRHLAVDHPGVLLLRVSSATARTQAELSKLEIGQVRIRYKPWDLAIVDGGAPSTRLKVSKRLLRTEVACDPGGGPVVGMTSPIARRTLALLRAGEAIEGALATWQTASDLDCADPKLTTAHQAAFALTQDAAKRLGAYCKHVGLSAECTSSGGIEPVGGEPCVSGARPRADLAAAAERLQLLSAAMEKSDPDSKP